MVEPFGHKPGKLSELASHYYNINIFSGKFNLSKLLLEIQLPSEETISSQNFSLLQNP